MEQKNLSLSIAVFGLDLCCKDEKMYGIMEKIPGLIQTCIGIVVEHFEKTGFLDESKELIAKIGRSADYSKCTNQYGKLGTFIDALSKAMEKEGE